MRILLIGPMTPSIRLTRTKIPVFVPCMMCILEFFFRTRDHSHAFFFRRSTDAPGSILENGNPSIIVHFLDSNLYKQGQSTLLSHELRFCSSTLSELTIATALSGRLEALRRGKNKKKMNALRENCKSALLVTSLISSIHFLEGCHFNGFRRASYRGGMRYHYIA